MVTRVHLSPLNNRLLAQLLAVAEVGVPLLEVNDDLPLKTVVANPSSRLDLLFVCGCASFTAVER
jgi:hypothetical protein